LSEEERRKILSGDDLFFKGNIVRLNKKHLQKELSRCRELGFARDVGEVTVGVNAVSAPVFGVGEKIIGCLILFGTFPVQMVDAFGRKVAEVARQVSYKIGADLRQL
jgi:DNA-binding IclR family transcriptional regulator